MTVKLTLTIDQDVIESAKHFARKKNLSVSRIVEDYLRHVSSGSFPESSAGWKAPITDRLTGMFQDPGSDYRELLDQARTERFL